MNKFTGIIGHFLKDRDFIGNLGNIGTLEGLFNANFTMWSVGHIDFFSVMQFL